MSDSAVRRAVNSQEDSWQAFHGHFDEFDRWCWTELYREADRLYAVVFDGGEVESDSPISNLHSALSAAAHHGAIKTFAAALGVDSEILSDALMPWLQRQDKLPPAVGFDGLKLLCSPEGKSDRVRLWDKYVPPKT